MTDKKKFLDRHRYPCVKTTLFSIIDIDALIQQT